MKFVLPVLTVLVLLALACNKDKFQTKPTISIKSMNTEFVPLNGTLVITLECTDKEGDVQDSVIIIRAHALSLSNTLTMSLILLRIPYLMRCCPC
jgi:hypothetical protein